MWWEKKIYSRVTSIETDETKDCITEEIKTICRKELRKYDLHNSSDTEEELNETIESCFYLHRSQVSQAMLKMMDKHKVTVTQLHEMKLKPRLSSNQQTDMTIELKRQITNTSVFKWDHETDGINAGEIDMDKKIDEEVFYNRRTLRKHVVLYDNKDEKDDRVRTFWSKEGVICIGAYNIGKNLNIIKSFLQGIDIG